MIPEKKPKAKSQRPLPSAAVQGGGKPTENLVRTRQRSVPSASYVVQDNTEDGSPLLEVEEFEDIYSFENFSTIINVLVGDSELLPEDVRVKYYKICCTHNKFLHTNLGQNHNRNLVVGLIIETVDVVHGIRSCKLNDTFNGELTVWRKKVEALEHLGMKIAFLIPRIDQIQKLSERAARRIPYE
ncbi:B3 domain-containing protein Os01g0234100-like [Papaver somniferum]|uniref:B3 domain-containing protein Os01g0234100-like n=1 Tax=Papaver somniferum TaxID=3469 RepID=UPI000E6F9F0A|nr:B3 domain-containing protein Os01g0234100-like [Papaver somniferum]